MLGSKMIYESIGFNVEGVKSAFDDKEGWSDLRGSNGVEFIKVDSWEFEEDEFYIEELKSNSQ